jgi:GNAT superfamily N-acetyltransferase
MTGRRLVLELPLVCQAPAQTWPCRRVIEDDAEDLAILLYAAFRGTVDDEGETFADALAEIEKTLAGGYGRPLLDCSFAIEEGEFLASACLISWFELHSAPLVVFSMTRPEAQRRGMGRFLVQQAINALLAKGYDRLTLVVTAANKPARLLYESLGFRPIG